MTAKINGKTPEEIKKGLECCTVGGGCDVCAYDDVSGTMCLVRLKMDALAYIQQLECERDAAVEDMTELMQLAQFCRHCKHISEDGDCTFDFVANKENPWCWQWRGVQEVE